MKFDPSLFMLKTLIVLKFANIVGDVIPSYFQVVVTVLWFVSVLLKKQLTVKSLKYSICSFVIFLITFLLCIYSNRLELDYFSPINSAIARYEFLIFSLIFSYVVLIEEEQRNELFKCSMKCITLTSLISLYYVLFIEPLAIRYSDYYKLIGVCDFQFVYSMAIFIGPYFCYIIDCYKRNVDVCFNVMVFILLLSCIGLSSLVTSVVIAVISLMLSFVIFFNKKIYNYLLYCILGIVVLCRKFFAEILILFSTKDIFNETINRKIVAIANIILGSDKYLDTYSIREDLTRISLNTFKENCWFGIDFKDHIAGVIGGHAQWADDLARYGILGNFFIIINYITTFSYMYKELKDYRKRKTITIALVNFLVLGFLNPNLSGTILLVIFVLVPCLPFKR